MQKEISNFVFDFGAVLFEWDPAVRVEKHFEGEWFGFNNATELAKNIFGHPTWHGFDQGVRSMDSVIESTSKRLGIEVDQLTKLIEPIGEDLAPIASSLKILEELRIRKQEKPSYRLFFLSNMPEPYARVLERKHHFLGWFDGGIFSADVKLAKPDLKIYKLLADRCDLDPRETLFIDDQLLNIQAAEELGWRGLHLQSPSLFAEKIKQFL